jgi:hypothetical protein
LRCYRFIRLSAAQTHRRAKKAEQALKEPQMQRSLGVSSLIMTELFEQAIIARREKE